MKKSGCTSFLILSISFKNSSPQSYMPSFHLTFSISISYKLFYSILCSQYLCSVTRADLPKAFNKMIKRSIVSFHTCIAHASVILICINILLLSF